MIYLALAAFLVPSLVAIKWRLALSEARGEAMAADVLKDKAESDSRGFRQELLAVREQNIRLNRGCDAVLSENVRLRAENVALTPADKVGAKLAGEFK